MHIAKIKQMLLDLCLSERFVRSTLWHSNEKWNSRLLAVTFSSLGKLWHSQVCCLIHTNKDVHPPQSKTDKEVEKLRRTA